MSIMRCENCSKAVDTDHSPGELQEVDGRMLCEGCVMQDYEDDERCPECGATDWCYSCASQGGWIPPHRRG